MTTRILIALRFSCLLPVLSASSGSATCTVCFTSFDYGVVNRKEKWQFWLPTDFHSVLAADKGELSSKLSSQIQVR
jgi:hypothetical protein